MSHVSNHFNCSNVNISRAAFAVVGACADLCSGIPTETANAFDRESATAVVTAAAVKLSDRRMKECCSQLLLKLAEAVTPEFVIVTVCAITNQQQQQQQKQKQRSVPVALYEALLQWLQLCVCEFGGPVGVSVAAVSAIGAFAVAVGESVTVAKVKKCVVSVLLLLYRCVGEQLRSIVSWESLPASLKSTVEDELKKKVSSDADSDVGDGFGVVGEDGVTVVAAAARVARGVSAVVGGDGGDDDAVVDVVVERVDVVSVLASNVFSDMKNTNGKSSWRMRKAALEAVIACCTAMHNNNNNNRNRSVVAVAGVVAGVVVRVFESNASLVELLKSLKVRLSDSQSNLKPLAAAAIGEVMLSVEEQCLPRLLRLVCLGLLGGMADNKKVMKDKCIFALQCCISRTANNNNNSNSNRSSSSGVVVTVAAAVDAMLQPLAMTLETLATGRLPLMQWIEPHLQPQQQQTTTTTTTTTTVSEQQQQQQRRQQQQQAEANTALVHALLMCLQDKTAAVRAMGEQCLIVFLTSSAFDVNFSYVVRGKRDFAPAVVRALQQPLHRIQTACAASATTSTTTTATTAAATAVDTGSPATIATTTTTATTATATTASTATATTATAVDTGSPATIATTAAATAATTTATTTTTAAAAAVTTTATAASVVADSHPVKVQQKKKSKSKTTTTAATVTSANVSAADGDAAVDAVDGAVGVFTRIPKSRRADIVSAIAIEAVFVVVVHLFVCLFVCLISFANAFSLMHTNVCDCERYCVSVSVIA